MVAINLPFVALTIGRIGATNVRAFIPIKAEPFDVFNELGFIARFAALKVGIFDAEDEDSALLAREKPVEKRGARVAYVNLSGGRWGKANANFACD